MTTDNVNDDGDDYDYDDEEDDDEPLVEPVLRDRQYKGFRSGESYDSYDPDNLSDVSVPSDEEGIKAFMAECTLDAHNERCDLHRDAEQRRMRGDVEAS